MNVHSMHLVKSQERGIFCPRCRSEVSTIFDTRKVPGGKKRLRKCYKCDHVFPTVEKVVAE